MSGNLTVVREMSGILLKIREMSGKQPCSVVTIASEPVSIDYDRSFEKNRDVDSMLHGHVD